MSSGFFFRSSSAGAVLRQEAKAGPSDLEAAVGMGERRRPWALVWRTGRPSGRSVA